MWLCLNDGFVSVVQDYHNPERLLVRARDASSIPRIFGSEYAVSDVPSNDYRYRASIPRDVVASVIAERLASIDYGNFKNSVKSERLHDAYVEMWGVMREYQDGR